ncbi:MAG: hypothetical protein BIFFINMI_02376 [Phycisphaerae bacterium]|nr:hypothetical protein [Phycisphaerae bacterium]
MRSRLITLAAAVLLMPVAPTAAWAWHEGGHMQVARLAARRAAGQTPPFFSVAAESIARASLSPDVFAWKPTPPVPLNTPQLRDQERPEHYCDLELLAGVEPPPLRSAFVALCAEKKLPPSAVGLLPYSIAEAAQRLMYAFAEYRVRPDDPDVRAMCVLYAGILAHYAADATQPLHTTVNYDGRVGADGASPHSGIHNRVDDLFGKLDAADVARVAAVHGATVVGPDRLFARVLGEIVRSHALVDRVYELDAAIPPLHQPLPPGEVTEFTAERLEAATAFLADLFASAWQDSADVELPFWWASAVATTQAAEASAPPEDGTIRPPRPALHPGWTAAALTLIVLAGAAVLVLLRRPVKREQ